MDTTSAAVKTEAAAESATLWEESFQGEVLGEAYFTRMRDLARDPVQRDKIDHLVRLERSTKEMLAPYLERHGLSTEPNAAVVEAMSRIEEYDWTTMLQGVRPVAADFLTKYRRLGELVGADDAGAVESLVAHELALDDFCRLELEGASDDSLTAIKALAHFR